MVHCRIVVQRISQRRAASLHFYSPEPHSISTSSECARSHASLDPQRGGDEFELNSEDHKSKHEDDGPGHHNAKDRQHRNAKDRSPKDRRPA